MRDRGVGVSRGHSRRGASRPKARTLEAVNRNESLERVMRQKIQLELALGSEGKGEARTAAPGGTEARAAAPVTENPAAVGPSMEAIVERDNVRKALAQVRRNKGAPGVDDMSVEDLVLHLKDHWLEIKAQLLAGTYRPQPVRRAEIPKPTGGVRALGIPTVLDRFIQQAVLQMLQADWDPTFSEASFGFRPGRSAHQAVARAQEHIAAGYGWVVDIDLEKFFLITHYPQPSRRGTKQEHTAVSAGLNDGAQQGAISKGAQRGPVCCSLRNRGSVPGGGGALALAIRLCLPGLRRGASQLRQDPGALLVVPPVDGRHP